MHPRPRPSLPAPPYPGGRGFTLIELLVVIVVLGIAAATLTTVAVRSAAESARLVRDQQKLAVASALLDEVRQMPFTYCDPNDAAYATATRAIAGGGNCSGAATVENLGPEAAETRYTTAGVNRYDNVNDYNGFTMPGAGCAGLCDADGTRLDGAAGPLPGLTGCSARVTVAPPAAAWNGLAALDADGMPQMLRATVIVSCPGDLASTVVETIKVRYAPNQV